MTQIKNVITNVKLYCQCNEKLRQYAAITSQSLPIMPLQVNEAANESISQQRRIIVFNRQRGTFIRIINVTFNSEKLSFRHA